MSTSEEVSLLTYFYKGVITMDDAKLVANARVCPYLSLTILWLDRVCV
jgi:hypothetical protein